MNKFEVETLTFQKSRPTSCPSFNIKRVGDSIMSLQLQQFQLQLIFEAYTSYFSINSKVFFQ